MSGKERTRGSALVEQDLFSLFTSKRARFGDQSGRVVTQHALIFRVSADA
jgi:hypothetical protein